MGWKMTGGHGARVIKRRNVTDPIPLAPRRLTVEEASAAFDQATRAIAAAAAAGA